MTPTTAGSHHVLLLGYFARGNVGDDAMRDALTEFAARRYPSVTVRCAPLHSIQGLRMQDGVDLLRSLRWANLVILAGGSHFHDRLGSRSIRVLTAFMLLFIVARALGVRVAYAGIGVGPVSRPAARAIVRALLRLSTATLVRDDASARTARELGPADAVLRGSEVTALLTVPQTRRREQFSALGLSLLPYFDLYEGDSSRDLVAVRNLAEAVAELHAAQSLEVRAFCFFRGSLGVPAARTDLPVTAELVRLLAGRVPVQEVNGATVQDHLAAFGEIDGLLAVRYHAALLGYLLGLPMIVVTYDQKSLELVREIKLPRQATLRPEDLLDRELVTKAAHGLRHSPDAFRAELAVEEMRARAQSGLERFARRFCDGLPEA